MNFNPISGVGNYGGVDPSAYQSRIATRQNMLTENCLAPVGMPTMDQAMGLQGFYNSTLGNINQLRYGCAYPDLSSMMMQNPQMMMFMMMYQQMQMQNMMLMMMLMGQQNGGLSPDMISSMLSNGSGANSCSSSSPYANSGGSGRPLADASKSEINNLLDNAAQKYGIPPDVLKSIAWQESGWKPGVTGDGGDSHGMMQINSPAHPDYDAKRGQQDIAYNIDYGAKLLKSLYDKYGSWPKAVERYNGSGPMAQKYASSVMGHVQNKPWLA
ncbi:MAG: lytic transglycosylase domain-containing protein [Candidatus Xenobiia bacterium LiM19]